MLQCRAASACATCFAPRALPRPRSRPAAARALSLPPARRSYNMLPALLKFSSAAAVVQKFPAADRDLHEECAASQPVARADARAQTVRFLDSLGDCIDEEEPLCGAGRASDVLGKDCVDSGLLDTLAL